MKFKSVVTEQEPQKEFVGADGQRYFQFFIPYSFELCVESYCERFPTHPDFPQIQGCEETRKQLEEHLIDVERKITLDMAPDFPGWLQKFTGKPTMLFLENSQIDYKNKVMDLKSENINFRERVAIISYCTYEAHSELENCTIKTIRPAMQILFSMWGLEKKVESLVESIFMKKISNAFTTEKKVMDIKFKTSSSSSLSQFNIPSTTSMSSLSSEVTESNPSASSISLDSMVQEP